MLIEAMIDFHVMTNDKSNFFRQRWQPTVITMPIKNDRLRLARFIYICVMVMMMMMMCENKNREREIWRISSRLLSRSHSLPPFYHRLSYSHCTSRLIWQFDSVEHPTCVSYWLIVVIHTDKYSRKSKACQKWNYYPSIGWKSIIKCNYNFVTSICGMFRIPILLLCYE